MSRSLQHPITPSAVKFCDPLSKDGILQIPLVGASDKVDKFRCLANTAILRIDLCSL